MILKRILFLTLFALSFIPAFAQDNWGGGVDNDDIHFGFTFQYVASEFKVFKKENWQATYQDATTNTSFPALKSISSPVSPGFGLGFVSDVRLGNHVNFRATPTLVFADRLINYAYEDETKNVQKLVQSATVDLPLGFKLKSDRRRNFRAYVIAGVKYSIDIISKKKLNDSGPDPYAKLVKNNRNILWYEVGVGFDLYFEFFKLSPEIKLANSFNQVLDRNDTPNAYSTPLEKLFLRNLQFSLYFE